MKNDAEVQALIQRHHLEDVRFVSLHARGISEAVMSLTDSITDARVLRRVAELVGYKNVNT